MELLGCQYEKRVLVGEFSVSFCVFIDLSYLWSIDSPVHSNVLCFKYSGEIVNVGPLKNIIAKGRLSTKLELVILDAM